MGFRSRPDIEAEVVSTRRLQPFVSKQGLDVPDRAPVKQERRGHRVPQHMRGHSLLEARQPRKPLEGRLHGVVSQAVWRVPSRDEEGLFVVSPATEIAFKPLHRSVGEEEHPLLVPFPMILTSLRPASTSHRSSARISDIRAPVPRSTSTRTRNRSRANGISSHRSPGLMIARTNWSTSSLASYTTSRLGIRGTRIWRGSSAVNLRTSRQNLRNTRSALRIAAIRASPHPRWSMLRRKRRMCPRFRLATGRSPISRITQLRASRYRASVEGGRRISQRAHSTKGGAASQWSQAADRPDASASVQEASRPFWPRRHSLVRAISWSTPSTGSRCDLVDTVRECASPVLMKGGDRLLGASLGEDSAPNRETEGTASDVVVDRTKPGSGCSNPGCAWVARDAKLCRDLHHAL
jgi:hypothetical protein